MKIDELKIEHSYGHKLTSKCIGFDSAGRPILTLISDEEEKEVEEKQEAPVEEAVEEAKAETVEEKQEAPKAPAKKPTAKKKPTSKKKK